MGRPKASAFLSKTADLTIVWGGEELVVKYYIHKFGSEMAKTFKNNKDLDPIDGTDQFLLEVLADLGLDDDQGKPVKITKDVIASLGSAFKDKVAGAIMEDIIPGEVNGATSPDGS